MAASRAAHLPHILRASRQVTAAARHNAACRRVFCALQCYVQDYKRALLLAELCSEGRPTLHKLGETHPMFKCVAIQVIRNHCCVDILHTSHSIVMLLTFDCATL